jgi:Mg2+ and Co2+ transporter CorA
MLINCVAYKEGHKVADIGIDEVQNYVSKPGYLVWVALREPDAATLDKLQHLLGLHPLAVEDTRNGHQRPKVEDYGDSLFAVMQIVEPDGAELRVGEVAVFAGSNYVVSVRSHAERGFQEVRARCEREPELLRLGSGFVLYALTDAVVDRYFPCSICWRPNSKRSRKKLRRQWIATSEHRSPVRSQESPHDRQACGGAAAGRNLQPLRRPRARVVRRLA